MLTLTEGNLAINEQGKRYKLANKLDGSFQDNPDFQDNDPDIFARAYGGHGVIAHLSDNPINPFWEKPERLFTNPERLPKGTVNVFAELIDG